jgi:hypothetical protein
MRLGQTEGMSIDELITRIEWLGNERSDAACGRDPTWLAMKGSPRYTRVLLCRSERHQRQSGARLDRPIRQRS